MEALYFIVNPVAGSGRSEENFALVETLLKEKGVPYEVLRTKAPLEATELAKAALEKGAKRIVAVGGDGTVNEVATALCGTEAAMGILPFGTGNDLARSLSIPSEPRAALASLLGGKVRRMDVGKANERIFVNVAGLGFDVRVLLAMDKYKKRFRGMLPYLLGVMDVLIHLKPVKARIEADCEEGPRHYDLDCTIVSVGNGRYFAGGMKVLPQAELFDGCFDVGIIEKVSPLRLLRLLPLFVKGRHLHFPIVKYFRARRIRVFCEGEQQIQVDGEVCSSTPVEFSILPGAIGIIVAGGAA